MSTQIQNFYKTTITRNWSATTGDFNVAVAPTTSSGWLVISPNNTTLKEIVKYSAIGTNAYGPFITISNLADRGVGGTSAQIHSIGEPVRMNITAEHWAEMQTEISQIVAQGSPDATTTTKGIAYLPIVETVQGTTLAITTTETQRVIVWVKGTCTPSGSTISLSYAGVVKDNWVHTNQSYGDNFSLMYTESPGVSSGDITVTTVGGAISSVVIIVMKF